jgi:ppGpp synthetase/RelA/SpoT-type nucleotidyltranferase
MDAILGAIGVLIEHRAAHATPLAKANMGLRSRVQTAKCENVDVSQRLKRVPTILDKLRREPTMQLATMQDIGGCRAVLASIDEIRRVQKRLAGRALKTNDYVDAPRESGYRGVHVIVQYDGYLTEVQLRTGLMHQWAYTVERLSGRLGVDLKAGKGPAPVLDWLKAVSRAMALEEAGQPPDGEGMKLLEEYRQKAVPFLEGGRS